MNKRDMSRQMIFNGRNDLKCECCGTSKWNGFTYIWITHIEEQRINVCQSCALREAFGNKHKQNKRYLQWRERIENE